MRGKHPNNKNIGSPDLFSCKSLREFNSFHVRYCIVQILILYASLHFTDNVVDLVSSVVVGLTFKDFLTTFRLVCHVLSTNRSCQKKGPKSKTEHMSAWIAHHTDPLECKVTYAWLDVHYRNFFLPSWKLAVIVNLACFTLPSAKNQHRFGKESRCK